jgi:hypothetical protein
VNTYWSFFLPLIGAGFVIGAIAISVGFRMPRAAAKARFTGEAVAMDDTRSRRWLSLGVGVIACACAAALWSGPFGAADRLTRSIERDARITLDNYEMPRITARLHRAPLSRRLILSGVADDFQQSELARILGTLHGVREVRWTARGGGVPLIAEGFAATLPGFLLGLMLAYLAERRRRYNAQWNW